MTFREWWIGWVKDRPNWNRGYEQAAWNAALEEAAKVAIGERFGSPQYPDYDGGYTEACEDISAAIRKLKETP